MMPGYWQNETSGVLRPAIEAYLAGSDMTVDQIAAMRAYLRQWINAGAWHGDIVIELRDGVDGLTTRAAIGNWLTTALEAGIDPP